jgi:hypothetical protein
LRSSHYRDIPNDRNQAEAWLLEPKMAAPRNLPSGRLQSSHRREIPNDRNQAEAWLLEPKKQPGCTATWLQLVAR